jgi:hypothetical protein
VKNSFPKRKIKSALLVRAKSTSCFQATKARTTVTAAVAITQKIAGSVQVFSQKEHDNILLY